MDAIRVEALQEKAASREMFERGRALVESGDADAALSLLKSAYDGDSNDAKVRSWYGLCVGLTQRDFDSAVALCQSAAKQEFFNPDLYLNLARLYLGFGFKAEGVRYLRRGLMIDPAHNAILQALRDLGDRSPPVLRFLPRRHPINRWLGAVRHTVSVHRPLRWAT
jgi:tetratricopeptide (TPR) repeat protein